jgi:predicted nucleic acid-binding protein
MIVVSDTTPLRYLILIDQVHLLPDLFGHVVTTPEVVDEMDQLETPEKLRQWASQLPDWLEIKEPSSRLPAVARLGLGEATAISLATELKADVLLIDERDGAKVARAQGLFVTGTLGVLTTASKKGLVSLREALESLASTNFRHSSQMFEKLIREDES